MRPRKDALKLAVLGLALSGGPGCGAVFHSSQTVTFVTRPEDKAVIYRDGGPITPAAPGTSTALVNIAFLNTSGGFVAVAPGKKLKAASPATHVDAVAIVCDILWSLTIIGVAAPISDALLGTFVKVDERVELKLEDDPPSANPMPVYSIQGVTVTGSLDAPSSSTPPPSSPSPPSPPPSSPPPAPKKP